MRDPIVAWRPGDLGHCVVEAVPSSTSLRSSDRVRAATPAEGADELAPISTDHHDDPVVADPDGRLTALEHDVARYRISRDTWTAFTFAFASIAAFAGIVAVGVAVARDPAQPATPSGETVQAHLTELVVSDKARSPSPMSCHSERMSTGTASTSPTARTVWPRSRRS